MEGEDDGRQGRLCSLGWKVQPCIAEEERGKGPILLQTEEEEVAHVGLEQWLAAVVAAHSFFRLFFLGDCVHLFPGTRLVRAADYSAAAGTEGVLLPV